MDVVRHDHKSVRFNARELVLQFLPPALDHLPGVAQAHLIACHLAQEVRPLLYAGGHEVRPRLSIVISPQADGATVMPFGVAGHAANILSLVSRSTTAGWPPIASIGGWPSALRADELRL
jgi:hypothetical protein